MSKARKFMIGVLAALSFTASIAASPPAEAWYRPYGWYGRWGGGWGWGGPAIAAGVLGGLALGTIAAGAAAPYYGYSYYPYPYSYAGHPYAGYPYGGYAYAVPRRVCRVKSPVFDAWGRFAGYRKLRVSC